MKLGQTSNNPTAILLRLPEFILPPPHPSVKERLPRGGLSYDQSQLGIWQTSKNAEVVTSGKQARTMKFLNLVYKQEC